jgi:glycine betaine/proline transport system ATP-binding protein
MADQKPATAGDKMTIGGEPLIVMRDVWKIFGERRKEALAALRRDGFGKDEIAKRFDCVVGVADVNLSVAKGEIFCIMGLSGSGKSTLVRHINRLLEPTSGEIFVGGENVMAKSPADLRSLRSHRIGMVFQNFGLLPHRTVRDNVALPLEIQRASRQKRFDTAEEALARVNLAGWGDRYCHELSGGMQQRVGLARALAADPDILLMDEPFSALDPLIRRQLQDEFLSLSEAMGKTVVFITHDLEEAVRIGDRIAVMKDGVILQVGTPEEVVTRPQHDYVERFVAEISRLNILTARSIMMPVDGPPARQSDADLGSLPSVHADQVLGDLVEIAAGHDGDIAVSDGNAIVGFVDRTAILNGLKRKDTP